MGVNQAHEANAALAATALGAGSPANEAQEQGECTSPRHAHVRSQSHTGSASLLACSAASYQMYQDVVCCPVAFIAPLDSAVDVHSHGLQATREAADFKSRAAGLTLEVQSAQASSLLLMLSCWHFAAVKPTAAAKTSLAFQVRCVLHLCCLPVAACHTCEVLCCRQRWQLHARHRLRRGNV